MKKTFSPLSAKSIKIGETSYPVELTVRALIEIGELTNDDMQAFQKAIIMFYCAVKAGGTKITYDEFLDLIDHHLESVTEFSINMLTEVEKKMKVV
jgi:hypothetical protein